MELEYPDRDAALLAYAEALEISYQDAVDALLSEDQLGSALARPRNAAAYENADLVRQAATLFWGITTDHPFRDGNKRLATVLLRAFLEVNGYELTLSEDQRVELALGVAEHHWSVDRVEEVLRPAVRPST
ncbi:MAG: type II toxin-antitoxin system death-on-curing family toxin [Chloroflexota bacterium]|nr:type II toxin-antitoxin system death-on-curing family toxin [Chloroflexota bacterium]